jgi:hypothetical protein
MANARDRQRKRGRRPPFRDPKPTILVVSEGEDTEPEYLYGFVKDCRNPRVKIEVVHKRGDPQYLVEAAKRRKESADDAATREEDENLAYDSVWCVFDVDANSRAAITAAEQLARNNGIGTAVSNPCFELWLLLHFRENPGMQGRAKMRHMLTKHVPYYDKHVDYGTYSAGYTEATKRSKQMDEAAENAGEPGRNPTTGVYKLTELIRTE